MEYSEQSKDGRIYVVMGVSGSGKSTVAPMLANELSLPFFDGDDFHPEANVQKMAARIPLNDDDRHDWLMALNQLAHTHSEKGAVIVCSALKASHRAKLSKGLGKQMVWVYLEGSFELILSRLQKRKGHFMPVELLTSQFETLEPPQQAIKVSINGSPKEIISQIIGKLSLQ